MILEIELERFNQIQVNADKLKKALAEIGQSATRNKKLGLAVVNIDLKDPEVVPVEDGGTKYRYVARVSIEQTKARSPEKTLDCFNTAYRLAVSRWRRARTSSCPTMPITATGNLLKIIFRSGDFPFQSSTCRIRRTCAQR